MSRWRVTIRSQSSTTRVSTLNRADNSLRLRRPGADYQVRQVRVGGAVTMPIGGIWWRTKASTANPPVVAGQKAPALLRAGTSGGELGDVVDPRRQPSSGTRTRRGR